MIRRAALAVWDFVVGDDWRLALAAVLAIGLTALACAFGLDAWWLAPLVALTALRWSLRRAATITQCDTSVSDLPTPGSSSSPASPRGPSTGTR